MDHHGTSPAGRFHCFSPPSNESWRWIQAGPHHKFAWDASKGIHVFLPSNLP